MKPRGRVRLFFGLVVILVARLIAFLLFPLAAEDAYITYHACRDAAWHIACTSSVWALAIMPNPEGLSRFWSLLGDLGAIYAAWRILPLYGFWAFVAYWVSSFFTGSAVSGLETHLAACALLVARVTPWGYALAAALRPDTAVLALCSSGRKWRWALAGAGVLIICNAAFMGHFFPQTILSKLFTYGIYPGAWGWLHPQGFGWMTLALLPALYYAIRNVVYCSNERIVVWGKRLSGPFEVPSLQGDVHAEVAEGPRQVLDGERGATPQGIRAAFRKICHKAWPNNPKSVRGLWRRKGRDASRGLLKASRRHVAMHQTSQGFAPIEERTLQVLAAVAFLLTHVALGTPGFYWYAVPPLAMLGFAACERITKPLHFVVALTVVGCFWPSQWGVLASRTKQEADLWEVGRGFAATNPTGTILLEPAGMIPYQNPQLTVIDDVGLLDPWMALRRAKGMGWRTSAIKHYKPKWIALRMREYLFPGTWTVGPASPYYGAEDSKLEDYGVLYAPGVERTGPTSGRAKMVSSNLFILMRKPNRP